MQGTFAAVMALDEPRMLPPTVLPLLHRMTLAGRGGGGGAPNRNPNTMLRPHICVTYGLRLTGMRRRLLSCSPCCPGTTSSPPMRYRAHQRLRCHSKPKQQGYHPQILSTKIKFHLHRYRVRNWKCHMVRGLGALATPLARICGRGRAAQQLYAVWGAVVLGAQAILDDH